jgi:hypothetical protein
LCLVIAESSSTKASPDGAAEGGTPARYRCAACGNLTRFDVVASRRTKSFHHYSVGGDLTVEDVEVLDESVEEVSCRWCGHGDAIEVLAEGAPPE